MTDLKTLLDGIVINKAFAPEFDTKGKLLATHCNGALRAAAHGMGCNEFDDLNLLMDDMIAIARKNASGRWSIVDGARAAIHALDGKFGFGGKTSAELNDKHGHGATIYPLGMQRSGSLGKDVPMCANLGGDPKTCGVVKISQAFPVSKGEPAYFIWI